MSDENSIASSDQDYYEDDPPVVDAYYKIYCNGFWNGFTNRETTTGRLNVNFFADILSRTMLKDFIFVDYVQDANVLFESVFAPSIVSVKNWKYKLHYSGESLARTDLYFPNKTYYETYDVVLCSHGAVRDNIIDCPFFVYYCYGVSRLDRLQPIYRYMKAYWFIPEKFCCMIVSNGNVASRNKILHLVNQYKRVDSAGKYMNNMADITELDCHYTSEEFIKFIAQYKFMICFENTIEGTYITEKIVNPFLARTIPIYFGTSYCNQVFNKDAFLYLEDESEKSYQALLEKVKELDYDDTKYLHMVNQPVFNPNFDYQNIYSVDEIANRVELILEKIPEPEPEPEPEYEYNDPNSQEDPNADYT
jgi:hypothetical protein